MRSQNKTSDDWSPDVARVSQEIASRLSARGIATHDSDAPEDVLRLLEAVEEFEGVVQAAGGDLMVDEPPSGGASQPDDVRFLLPKRGDDQSVGAYVERLAAATAAAREAPRRD